MTPATGSIRDSSDDQTSGGVELTDGELAELFKTKPDFPYESTNEDGGVIEEHVPELPENVRRMMERRQKENEAKEEQEAPQQEETLPLDESTPEPEPEPELRNLNLNLPRKRNLTPEAEVEA